MQIVISNIARIKLVFPSLSEGFYDVLIERLKYYKFSDVEFKKTVDHIFDTCDYPPTISKFISFMRPDGVSDIPDREPKALGYHDIDWANVPKNEDTDLSFLDAYGPESEKPKIEKPKGFEDFEPCYGQD